MTPSDRRAGALAQRLAALLCLTAAAVFGLVAALIARLDRVPDSAAYRLPGGAVLDPAALMLLEVCAGAAVLCGLALLVFVPSRSIGQPQVRRRRPATLLVLGIVALLAALAVRRFG